MFSFRGLRPCLVLIVTFVQSTWFHKPCAPRQGLEPRMIGPKPIVLPITPTGNSIFLCRVFIITDKFLSDTFLTKFYIDLNQYLH
jgi:hypothetical protein